MSLLNVALLQMTSCGSDQDANLAKGKAFCRRAKLLGADVALFPEMWSNGYPDLDADHPDARPSTWIACGRGGNPRCGGNAFRRPRAYGPLTATDVQPPFVRASSQR